MGPDSDRHGPCFFSCHPRGVRGLGFVWLFSGRRSDDMAVGDRWIDREKTGKRLQKNNVRYRYTWRYIYRNHNAIFDRDISIFELINSKTVVHKSLSTLFCVCPPSHPFICPPMLKNLSKTIFDRFLQRVFYHLSPKIRSNVEGFWNQKSSCNWKRWLLHCGVKNVLSQAIVGKNNCQSFFSVTHTVSGVKIIFHWAYR